MAKPAAVSITGALLQPAELRVSGDGLRTTLRLVVEQGDKLPPVSALLAFGGEAAYIAWRYAVRSYARGAMVSLQGRGLRSGTFNGRRTLVLEPADSVQLLDAPAFDGRSAAAGERV